MGWYSWAAWIEGYLEWINNFLRILEKDKDEIIRVVNKNSKIQCEYNEKINNLSAEIEKMDAKIRKIEKESKKTTKDLKDLEKMDKKRDKFVEKGKERMKKSC